MIKHRVFRWVSISSKRWWSYVLRYSELQLFIQLCAWPILAAWGIPLAPAGLIGNLLFGPCITLFLGISSCIFIAELLSLPYAGFCSLLELLTACWYHLLSLSNRSWLFHTAHPPFMVTLMMPLSGCFIMLFKPIQSPYRRMLCFILIYASAGYIIPWYYRIVTQATIPFGKGTLIFIQTSTKTILIDPGVTTQSASSTHLITYTLVPWLVRRSVTHLDYVISTRISTRTLHALVQLGEQFPVTALYLPYKKGRLSNRGWLSWYQLRNLALRNNIRIITTHAPTYLKSENMMISLIPSQQKKRLEVRYIDLPHAKAVE